MHGGLKAKPHITVFIDLELRNYSDISFPSCYFQSIKFYWKWFTVWYVKLVIINIGSMIINSQLYKTKVTSTLLASMFCY